MKKNLRNRNFTSVKNHVLPADCRELTEAELILVNGGQQVSDSNAAVAGAQAGDTITRENGQTITLKQSDIDWVKAHSGNSSDEAGTSDLDASGASDKKVTPIHVYGGTGRTSGMNLNGYPEYDHASINTAKESELSDEGKEFIKKYEGYKDSIYDAKNPEHEYKPGDSQENGDWTIGYGHKLTAQELSSGIFDGGITEPQAAEIFEKDVKTIENAAKRKINDYNALSQNKFDALVSVFYNSVKADSFGNDFNKLTEIYGAPMDLRKTDEVKKEISDLFREYCPPADSPISKGIKNRRYNEAQMFLYGDYEVDDTPSYLIPWHAGTTVKE